MGAAGGAAGSTAAGSNGRIVFVKTAQGFRPRLVRVGLSDYDYTQVLSGLQEGENVVLLNVVEVQAKRVSDQNQLRQRMGSGVGGVPGTGTSRTGTTRSSSSGTGTGGTRTTGTGR